MHEERGRHNELFRRIAIAANESGTPIDLERRLNDRLQALHAEAISNPGIKEVRQVKIGRNDTCPCGSGRKFKRCCLLVAEQV